MLFRFKTIFASLALLFMIIGCGGGGGGGGTPAKEAEVKIGALQMGGTTVFRVTLKSVTGLDTAVAYNLIGDDKPAPAPKGFNEQVENFVVNKTTILLELYNIKGAVVASAVLNANDYVTEFEGTFSFDQGKPVKSPAINRKPDLSFSAPTIIEKHAVGRAQVGNLDILASGIIHNLIADGTTRHIQVPLNCGATQAGTIVPPANEGFFIINDVTIEFNYAFDNPLAFNNVFSVKFIESDRNFDNMKLYFRLPGRTSVIDARTGRVLTAAEVADIFKTVTTAVNKNNPFAGVAVAYADVKVTQFGPSKLVETTVTRVEGDCVVGANSFTVQDSSEAPEPYKAFNERVDKNTLHNDIILHILGNKIEIRDDELKTCGSWSAANSGGAAGTLDRWDITTIPVGARFDFKFDAYSIPDKFRVEYPIGTVQLNTGWRGSQKPNNGEALEGPGKFEKIGLFYKAGSNSLQVMVSGEQPGTAWNYSIRCINP